MSTTTATTNVRSFVFEDGRQTIRIKIPEVLHPQYGMYTWPSAVILAQYLWYHRKELLNKQVLEIGAGTALPGVMATICGAKVTLSEDTRQPACLMNCQQSCQLNDLNNVSVVGITWGIVTKVLISLKPINIILGSDCFYDPLDFEDILFTVVFLLRRNPHCKFLCTYQVRSSDWTIEDLLAKWNLHYRHIPLSKFDAEGIDIAKSGLPGRSDIEMMEISMFIN